MRNGDRNAAPFPGRTDRNHEFVYGARRRPGSEYERPWGPSGFFVLRTPLLPFDHFDRWLEDASLDDSLGDPVVREALFLASPELLDALHVNRSPHGGGGYVGERNASGPKVHSGESGREGKKARKLRHAVFRYLSRMAGRSTPFGLFAGVSLGTIGEQTSISLSPREEYRRATRLDMDYVDSLTSAIVREPNVRRRIRLLPNTSLHRIGDRLRYAEARHTPGSRRSYFLASVELDSYLDRLLEAAEFGQTPDQLVSCLLEEAGNRGDLVSEEEASLFLGELVEAQVLVPELAPLLTGSDALSELTRQLESLLEDESQGMCRRLREVGEGLEGLDERGVGRTRDEYAHVESRVRSLPGQAESKSLFQVDMLKPVRHATIGSDLVDEVLDVAVLLHRANGSSDDGLASFRSAFRERYGDREVELASVLDEEFGIGFRTSESPTANAVPLLDGIPFVSTSRPLAHVPTRFASFRRRWLANALRSGDEEIHLQADELLSAENPDRLPLPDAFHLFGSLLDGGSGRRFWLTGVSGPSGARLLGRFCHLDPSLANQVREHLASEEAQVPDVVFAEIVHLPEGRTGNVLARPRLREYEIPFLGRSSVPTSRQIPVSDLLVSVNGDTIRLRSRRLGCEVRPRLTTAHNTRARTIGTYRFLSALQYQGVAVAAGWAWGDLDDLPFLPRVVIGSVVVSPKTWNLWARDIAEWNGSSLDASRSAVATWRQGFRVPRHVGLVDGDNVLPVDLDNPTSVDILRELVRNRGRVRIRESATEMGGLVVDGPEGQFANEVLIPCVRTVPRPGVAGDRSTPRFASKPSVRPSEPTRPGEDGRMSGTRSSATSIQPTSTTRLFPPGSEWLYAKIYGARSQADSLLAHRIGPMAADLLSDGVIDRWFFLRYADPKPHLRVRFQGEPAKLMSVVLPRLHDLVGEEIREGVIESLQLDTYDREVERYGGSESIGLCEEFFAADSDAVVELLRATEGEEGLAERHLHLLVGIDRLLEDFGIPLESRFGLLQRLSAGYSREFSFGGSLKKKVYARVRDVRADLTRLRARTDSEAENWRSIWDRRSERAKSVVRAIRTLEETNRLERSSSDVLASLIHMSANRMLRASARAQELVIYHTLDRCYDSELARHRAQGRGGAGEGGSVTADPWGMDRSGETRTVAPIHGLP